MVPHVEPHWFHLILHSIRYKLGKWFHILEPISIFWGKWFHIHKWNHYGSTWFPIVLCMFGDNGSTFFSKFGKWFHIGRSTVVPQHLSNFLQPSTCFQKGNMELDRYFSAGNTDIFWSTTTGAHN